MNASQVRRNANLLVLLLLGLSVAAGVAAVRGGGRVAGNGTIRYGGVSAGPGVAPYGYLRTMPHVARAYAYRGLPYYWYSGGWYAPAYYGEDLYYYPVIEPMPGIVGSVPMPYSIVRIGNGVYYVSNGVYYQPFTYLNTVWYRVVAGPGQ